MVRCLTPHRHTHKYTHKVSLLCVPGHGAPIGLTDLPLVCSTLEPGFGTVGYVSCGESFWLDPSDWTAK